MSAAPTERMRVLMVARETPWPLNHGGRLRLYNLLVRLADHADVTLAVVGKPQHTDRLPEGVRVMSMLHNGANDAGREHQHPTRRGAAPAIGVVARLVRRHFGHDAKIAEWLRRNAEASRFDAVFISGVKLGQYIEDVGVPAVWDPADDPVLYWVREAQLAGPGRWPAALRAGLFDGLYLRYVGRHAAATLFCSPVDASFARRWMGSARVEVVRTCVDSQHYRSSDLPAKPGSVLFVGALDFPPNIDAIVHFATTAWRDIFAASAGRVLHVVGRNPGAAVRKLAALPGVDLIGEVPDVRPYYASAAVVVVPTRCGGGVKNKVLEACAMGRPLVAGPRALAGLGARPGRDVLWADSRAEWARAVSKVLDDEPFARTLGEAGRAWVRRAHQWPTAAERLRGVLESIRTARGAGRRTAMQLRDPGPRSSRTALAPPRGSARQQPEAAPCH